MGKAGAEIAGLPGLALNINDGPAGFQFNPGKVSQLAEH